MIRHAFNSITDVNHLKNHLKYLFRNDTKQKWSNDNTKSNIYLFTRNSTYSQTQVTSRERRKDIMKATMHMMKFRAGEKPMDDYVQNLRLLMIEAPSIEELLYTLDTLVEAPEYVLIGVIHQDEGSLHLHAIIEKELAIVYPKPTIIKEE